jgi:predicted phage replisome organizer
MSGVKWIRIKTNISLDAKFKQIDTMPDADSIECMWFKLIRFSGRLINDGIFLINDKMAYSEQMLSKEFNRPIELIRKAMNTFYKLRMIDIEYEESDMEKQIVASKTSDKVKPEKESTHFVKLRTNEQNFKAIIAGNESFSAISSNSDFYNSVLMWMQHKDGKLPKAQNHYNSELSMTRLLNQMIRYADKFGITAVRLAIDSAISANYMGIVWNRMDEFKKDADLASDDSSNDRFSVLSADFRAELEKSGVIVNQAINYAKLTTEQADKIRATGVTI